MKIHAAIAAIVAVLVGVMVFVFVQIGGSDGSGVKVGTKSAEACAEESPTCLPMVPFIDRAGKMWDQEELVGKLVVVNVWATWCKPCQHEMPDLVALRNQYGDDDLVLLGVLKDSASDTIVERFAAKHQVNYPIVPMNSELEVALDYPSRLPTTFIYDRNGHLVERKVGAVTISRLKKTIDELL